MNSLNKTPLRVVAWVASLFFGGFVHADTSMPSLDKNGVAARGYDPVAYFVERRAVKGKPAFAVELENGAIYHFSSGENQAIFLADPNRYLPQYGGRCAFAAAQGVMAEGDPNAFRVIDGKLYFIANQSTASKWSQNATTLIRKADANALKGDAKPSP